MYQQPSHSPAFFATNQGFPLTRTTHQRLTLSNLIISARPTWQQRRDFCCIQYSSQTNSGIRIKYIIYWRRIQGVNVGYNISKSREKKLNTQISFIENHISKWNVVFLEFTFPNVFFYIRSRVQKFPAWHTKAAPNGKCCEGYIVPSMVRSMY